MTVETEFVLNAANEIISVGGDWDRFALENGAAELAGNRMIGRSLLDAVSGNVTRQFTLALLEAARQSQQAIELEYRCDSPDERRYMLMRVSHLGNNEVRMSHILLRSEAKSHRVLIRRAPQRGRNTPVRCSVCNQVRPHDQWLEPEQLPDQQLAVIYGVCDACASRLRGAARHVGLKSDLRSNE